MKPYSVLRRGALVLALVILARVGMATPLYFSATDSYYDVVFTSLTWSNAEVAAASSSYLGRPGRLATITSLAENNFVVSNFLTPGGFGQSAWIGGYQPNGDIGGDPAAGWAWIDGELWSFTNWASGEPSNSGGDENFLQLDSANQLGQWNDHANDGIVSHGYVIEYAAVPEPSALAFGGLGGIVFAFRRFRRKA